MTTKNIKTKFLLLLSILFSMSGCAHKDTIENQSVESVMLTTAKQTQSSTQISFPSQIQEENGKVIFNTPVVLAEGADLSKLTVNSVSYKTINKDTVYNQLFQGVQTVRSQKYDSGKTESYGGNKEETLLIMKGGINFFSDKARPVLRSFHSDRQSERYNVDKYSTNADFDFSTRTQALNQIISELAQFGIDLEDNYEYRCYSLDYKTMESEEYAIDRDGVELKSTYKKDWNIDDNCYYFCIWQTCDNLPVVYSCYSDIKGDDAPIHVIYSKRGIEFLTTQMTLNFTPGSSAVPFASLDKVKDCIANRFNPIITDEMYTVEQMELIYMAQLDRENNYSVSPVWLVDLVSTESNGSNPYWFQIKIDAQTAKEIVQ